MTKNLIVLILLVVTQFTIQGVLCGDFRMFSRQVSGSATGNLAYDIQHLASLGFVKAIVRVSVTLTNE